MDRIDAHQHFWRVERGDYHWMDDSVAPIRRDILPEDILPLLVRHGIDGSVVVQAAATEAETRFLLALAKDAPFVRGVVGWVDLESADVANRLEDLASDPKLKGVRPMLQDIDDTDWIARPAVVQGLRAVAERGLRLDTLVQPRHLRILTQVAEGIPELPIVIDHCAKPLIAGGVDPGDGWRADMARLAALPQVMCKLSGLANEAGQDWSAEELRPVADHVLQVFGPERVMWGSDWPVLEMVGIYDGWVSATETLLSGLTPNQRAQVLGGTATQFYGLEAV